MYFNDPTTGVHSDSMSSKASDAELVAIAQAGSHSAFAELFLRHHNILSRTVQRITKNVHDTEDVLQDSSIKAFIHIKSFDGRSAFSTWLLRIAINTTLMALRKRKRVIVDSLDDYVDFHRHGPWQIAEPSNGPEEELLEREKQSQVHEAVSRLPTPLRIVLDAHRFHDRSLKELANINGLTVAATKSRLYRARNAVRDSVQRMQRHSLARRTGNTY